MRKTITTALGVLLLGSTFGGATETENHELRVVPAPGPVVIDGKAQDWDLSGGVFVCGDVETLRETAACWLHAMYDTENLYLLARWMDDTPMNNPGSIAGDLGFQGDCLQVRFITHFGSKGDGQLPAERVTHVTAWKGVDGDVVDLCYGRDFKGGGVRDIRPHGGNQAFRLREDDRGYDQEIALPWKLLTSDRRPLRAGDAFRVTVEPNFTIDGNRRLSIKDLFRAGVTPDRVFTFRAYDLWGRGVLMAQGRVPPLSVRLADAREFSVRLEGGIPTVDWSGLFAKGEVKGHKSIRLALEEDAWVSLVIREADGRVVRHLLNATFLPRGTHEVRWDGLTNPRYRDPGEPVPPGEYRWEGLVHPGLGIRFLGQALNGENPLWKDGHPVAWGGDHGPPSACVSDGDAVYLGWRGAEAGRAVVAVTGEGEVRWTHKRGGIGGAQALAVDPPTATLYVLDRDTVYRLDTRTGKYRAWEGRDTAEASLASLLAVGPENGGGKLYGMAVRDGVLLLNTGRALVAVDAARGEFRRRVAYGGAWVEDLVGGDDGHLYGCASLAERRWSVVKMNTETGELAEVLPDEDGTVRRRVHVSRNGTIYVAVAMAADGTPLHQVYVYGQDGRRRFVVGEKGGWGRGPWNPRRLRNIADLTVDGRGQLWVAEGTEPLRRISVWDARTGQFLREHLGPSHYGCSGAAVWPKDPTVFVAVGAEFRLNPATGRSRCTGYFGASGSFARFCQGTNGLDYLAVFMDRATKMEIWERVGEGDYRLRARVYGRAAQKDPPRPAATVFWADVNGDEEEQPEEIGCVPRALSLGGYYGWSGYIHPDLTLYPVSRGETSTPKAVSRIHRIRVKGFTECGAPQYDLSALETVVEEFADGGLSPLPSMDHSVVVSGGDTPWIVAFDGRTGRELWRYPNLWSGVHGSHRAPPGEPGLLRGVFGCIGSVRAGGDGGDVFCFNTNVGEWHLFTASGFYLSPLFEGNPIRWKFPEEEVPGAVLDRVPSGSGGEDFGGSFQQSTDGRIFAQTGKAAVWITEVIGWERIRKLPQTGTITLTEDDVRRAQEYQTQYRQQAVGRRRLSVAHLTVTFTGDLAKDFAGAEEITFGASGSRCRVRVAADEARFYVGYEVEDPSPWKNGADTWQQMYTKGDTVDFQMGADPRADPKRKEPVSGDLRVSVGNFQGQPVAVLYRPISSTRHPWTAFSGVVREGWTLDEVRRIEAAQIHVKTDRRRYVVEIAVPWSELGISYHPGVRFPADFGVTLSDEAGTDTRGRVFWNNQSVGLVDDDVFELKLQPANWGEIELR